jgi:solute carrier family 29 (equilibrative nucleoside transporter) protein 4
MDHDDEYESNNEGETILLENMEATSEDSDRRELLPPSSQEEYRPKDKCHIVYIVIIIVSTGLLFPYNSYIVGLDYFQYLYPDDRTEFILPLTYLLTTLIFVTVTIGIVNYAPLHARILLGYVLFIIPLLLVPLLDIGVNNCTVSPTIGFILTCLSFVIVGIGSGVQQSSYYGLAGMLPERFTQAMMLGESLAGTVVSISRIITKATSGSERIGAIVFFVISLLFMLFCMGCQAFLWKSSFVRHYVDIAKSKQAIDDNSEQPLMAATSVSSQNKKTCFSLKNWPDKIISKSSLRVC